MGSDQSKYNLDSSLGISNTASTIESISRIKISLKLLKGGSKAKMLTRCTSLIWKPLLEYWKQETYQKIY